MNIMKYTKPLVIAVGVALLCGCASNKPAPQNTIYVPVQEGGLVDEPIVVSRLSTDVLFDYGSADLNAQALRDLQVIATTIQRYPNPEVIVTGHADGAGPANLALSQRRADAVSEWLSLNTRAIVVRSIGVGNNAPRVIDDNSPTSVYNRRVEVHIRNR